MIWLKIVETGEVLQLDPRFKNSFKKPKGINSLPIVGEVVDSLEEGKKAFPVSKLLDFRKVKLFEFEGFIFALKGKTVYAFFDKYRSEAKLLKKVLRGGSPFKCDLFSEALKLEVGKEDYNNDVFYQGKFFFNSKKRRKCEAEVPEAYLTRTGVVRKDAVEFYLLLLFIKTFWSLENPSTGLQTQYRELVEKMEEVKMRTINEMKEHLSNTEFISGLLLVDEPAGPYRMMNIHTGGSNKIHIGDVNSPECFDLDRPRESLKELIIQEVSFEIESLTELLEAVRKF